MYKLTFYVEIWNPFFFFSFWYQYPETVLLKHCAPRTFKTVVDETTFHSSHWKLCVQKKKAFAEKSFASLLKCCIEFEISISSSHNAKPAKMDPNGQIKVMSWCHNVSSWYRKDRHYRKHCRNIRQLLKSWKDLSACANVTVDRMWVSWCRGQDDERLLGQFKRWPKSYRIDWLGCLIESEW